ncbi:MAG: response regulator [Armatimonadetes bacterium]|nr:response regulator [Anaerolineae bacterium]
MRRKFSGSPIARYQVFTLADGSYVVQWDDKRVQELLTGKYRDFEPKQDFGHPLSEWELNQLKAAGRVEHFNRDFVWLLALPEAGRFGVRKEMGRGDRIRAYYLSTLLPKSQLANIQQLLTQLALADTLTVVPRQQLLAVMDAHGAHFRDAQTAEAAQAALLHHAPDLFAGVAIGIDEISLRAAGFGQSTVDASDDDLPFSFDELVASQNAVSVTSGRQIVTVLNRAEEREAFDQLFVEMEIFTQHSKSGAQVLSMLEDYHADLLLLDLTLPDMHGWQLVQKAREIDPARTLPMMIITDETSIGMTVAKVDYLTRPVSIARLRHNIWKIFKEKV